MTAKIYGIRLEISRISSQIASGEKLIVRKEVYCYIGFAVKNEGNLPPNIFKKTVIILKILYFYENIWVNLIPTSQAYKI